MFGDSGDEAEGLYLIFVYLWSPCDDGDNVGDDGAHGDMLAMFLRLGSQWCFGAGLMMVIILMMCSSRGDGDNVGDDADDCDNVGDDVGDDAGHEMIFVIHQCSPR